MNDESISLQDLLGILKRNQVRALITVAVFSALAVAVTFVMPTQYKSMGLLSISTDYFQTPLARDLVSEVRDNNQLRAQLGSIIQLAISDRFVENLGEKHKIFETPSGTRTRAEERAEFKKKISFDSINITSYQVSAIHESPETSKAIATDVLQRVMETLIDERKKKLIIVRDNIQEQLQSLGLARGGSTNPLSTAQPSFIKSELKKIEGQIQALKSRYSDLHPKVVNLKKKRKTLKQLLKTSAKGGGALLNSTTQFRKTDPNSPNSDFYNELLRRLNYLNIVINMERTPESATYLTVVEEPKVPIKRHSPKRRHFAGGGFAIGLFFAFVSILLREVRSGSFLVPSSAARQLGVKFLGELPDFDTNQSSQQLTYQNKPQLSDQSSSSAGEPG